MKNNNKDNMDRHQQHAADVAEINKAIREALNQWADIMLRADADGWAYELNYFPRDIMNATFIFQHVCSVAGIKSGRITEETAKIYGRRLRQLVIDMTGLTPGKEALS